ncbi:MAG: hypothetical protein RL326_923 [Pseudomonadota bacterium]|jgi:uncharacterized membrane protein YeaQ/YmgE (transglycosylase-associated protein family)
MHIIWTILIGCAVGLIARAVMPGRDDLNVGWTTALGISGALLGAVIGRATGLYEQNEPAGFVVSVLGAILVLSIYRYVVPGTTSSRLG